MQAKTTTKRKPSEIEDEIHQCAPREQKPGIKNQQACKFSEKSQQTNASCSERVRCVCLRQLLAFDVACLDIMRGRLQGICLLGLRCHRASAKLLGPDFFAAAAG